MSAQMLRYNQFKGTSYLDGEGFDPLTKLHISNLKGEKL